MRRLGVAVLVCLGLFGCGAGEATESIGTSAPGSPSGVLAQVPPEMRISNGGAEPRGGDYWVIWSTCGEGSQADVAKANGGREAGWVLLDDLLEDPGVAIAGHRVRACRDAVAILSGGASEDTVAQLSAQSLAAEVNLAIGAETCVASDGVVQVARALLASLPYEGPGTYAFDDEVTEQRARETIELLSTYNQGALCQGA